MVQICVDCKKEFDDPAPAHGGNRKQRCPACQRLHSKQLQAAARERKKAARIKEAKTETAKRKTKEPTTPEPTAAQNIAAPAPILEKKGKPRSSEMAMSAPKGENDHLSIEEVARLADAEGMSYGQYVALKLNRVRS